MEEAPENGKESSNSAHANGMNELMWKNISVPGRPQMTIRRMRIICSINEATGTLPE